MPGFAAPSTRPRLPAVASLLAGSVFLGEASVWLVAGSYFWLVNPQSWAEHSVEKMILAGTYCLLVWLGLRLGLRDAGRWLEAARARMAASYSRVFAMVLVAGYFLHSALFVYLGGLRAREVHGNYLTAQDSLYWLRGFEGFPMLATLYLFHHLVLTERPGEWLLKYAGMAATGLSVALTLVSGGRGTMMAIVAGLLLSAVLDRGWKKVLLRPLPWAALLAVGMVFYLVGELRTLAAYGGAGERWEAFQQELQAKPDSALEDLIEKSMFRLSELYGHVVINESMAGEKTEPFLNFDRLLLTFVPAALAPAKQPLDDGPENLALYFGFANDISDFKSLPITFQADLFWRFGYWGPVLGAGLVVSLTLLWTRAVLWLIPEMAAILVVYLAMHLMRVYPSSVLGVIGLLTYKLGRDVFIFLTLATVFGMVQSRRSTRWEARP